MVSAEATTKTNLATVLRIMVGVYRAVRDDPPTTPSALTGMLRAMAETRSLDRGPDRSRIPAGALVAAAIAAMLLAGAASGSIDGDLLHELSLFREMLEIGGVPRTDSFAFTPTVEPVVHHEWGFGALAHGAIAVFGASGILLIKFLLIAALGGLAYREAKARGATPATLALCAPVAAMLVWSAFATVRAHLATLFFVLVLLRLLRRDREFLWIPLQLVWQNLHGGFVAGVALLAIHAVEDWFRRGFNARLAIVIAATPVVVFLNPWGSDYPPYLLRALTMSRPLITEWHSVFAEFSFALLLFLVALEPIVYALIVRGPRALPGLPLVLFCAVEAALHQRFLPLFAVVAFVHVPGWLAHTPLGSALATAFERRRFAIAYASIVVALPMLGQSFVREFWRVKVPAFSDDRREHVYPVGAVDYLRDLAFTGNLVTAFGDGSYVSWKLHPAVKVSLDSRYEVAYRDGLIDEHQDFYTARGDDISLPDRYGADLILVPEKTGLAKKLGARKEWSRCYVDDSYSLYQRADGELPSRDRRGERFEGVFP